MIHHMSTYIIIFVDLFSFIYNANQMPGHLIRPGQKKALVGGMDAYLNILILNHL